MLVRVTGRQQEMQLHWVSPIREIYPVFNQQECQAILIDPSLWAGVRHGDTGRQHIVRAIAKGALNNGLQVAFPDGAVCNQWGDS